MPRTVVGFLSPAQMTPGVWRMARCLPYRSVGFVGTCDAHSPERRGAAGGAGASLAVPCEGALSENPPSAGATVAMIPRVLFL